MTTKIRRVDLSPDEWIAGCQGLSEEEEGIYMRLTTRMYSRGGPLALAGLAAYCGSDPRKFWRIVRQLWAKNKVIIRDQNGWDIEPTSRGDLAEIGETLAIHRCEVELKCARDRSEIGEKLAAKRWNINKVIDAVPHMRARSTNHQPSTINHQKEEERILSGRLPDQLDDLPCVEAPAIGSSVEATSPRAESLKRPTLARSVENGEKTHPLEVANTMTSVWNEVCGGISQARPPKASRVRSCALRWRDEFAASEAQWRAYCQRIAAAPHLRGENDRGWHVDLDWVLEPRNIAKIQEGRYDPRRPAAAAARPASRIDPFAEYRERDEKMAGKLL
jgi:hypothetical protein